MSKSLNSDDAITQQFSAIGISDWSQLIAYIQQLPYGRTTNRADLSLVIKEQKGTCSSKHALLKKVADLNGIKGIQLIISIYKMSETNTPGIGQELTNNGLAYIPEAHCYLKVNGIQTDYTATDASFKKIQADILEELIINPEQITSFKVDYHKKYIKSWLKVHENPRSFEEIWQIRENCILNLSMTS